MSASHNAPHHDVVVVGARCAGAATAMLLAERGHDVVVVDRAALPSDTISTHSIARGGLVLVPEGRQVFPELTVVENIRLGAFGRGTPIDPAEVERLLDRFPRLRDRAILLARPVAASVEESSWVPRSPAFVAVVCSAPGAAVVCAASPPSSAAGAMCSTWPNARRRSAAPASRST